MNNLQTLQQMVKDYRDLPYDQFRVALNQQALALAEELNLPFYRIDVRYDLLWAYAVGDDSAKALPVCAEFFALLEEYPNILTPEDTRRDAVSAAMVAAHVAGSMPQIPLVQYRSLMEQFHDQVKRYGLGERLWQMHASHFCLLTGDSAGAEAHLNRFWETPRDAISDCKACETSNAAEILLGLGLREEALEVLRPVLDGSLTCEQQPWSVLSVLIHDALDHGELERAVEFGRRLARHTMESVNDLSYIGALLRLSSHTGPKRSVALLEKGLGWSVGVWDQELLFDFYRGAWQFCLKLGGQAETIPLSLSSVFPLYRKDGVYHCSALARWFYDQAESIARRFDQRNGSDYYGRKLMPAGIKE